jgi:hypothetical protein
MAKKNEDLKGKTAEELSAILATEREDSAKRQEEHERRENQREEDRKAAEARTRQLQEDRDRNTNQEPTDEQWGALETKYEMTRDEIKKHWKLVNAANAGIAAELQGYRLKDAASETTSAALRKAAKADPQFPKYADLVDEYLADLSLSEKADPVKMEKHMDRAVNYARGKARAAKRPGIQDLDQTRDAGEGADNKDGEGFGMMEVAGLPLQIHVEKRVDDDFRKTHSHPERPGAVLMNERKKWNDQIPKKPR